MLWNVCSRDHLLVLPATLREITDRSSLVPGQALVLNGINRNSAVRPLSGIRALFAKSPVVVCFLQRETSCRFRRSRSVSWSLQLPLRHGAPSWPFVRPADRLISSIVSATQALIRPSNSSFLSHFQAVCQHGGCRNCHDSTNS